MLKLHCYLKPTSDRATYCALQITITVFVLKITHAAYFIRLYFKNHLTLFLFRGFKVQRLLERGT